MNNDIKTIREGLGWSQEYLAHRLKCSRQHVIAIEKGKHDPSLELALRIAKLFRRPVERIFSAATLADGANDRAERVLLLSEPSQATAYLK